MKLNDKTKKTVTGASIAAMAVAGLLASSTGVANAELVGPSCAAYAKAVPTGPGSVSGMAMDPVAVAASNNPMLTTLTKAVSGQLNPEVNLVDALNSDEFTVFAPTDDAFKKLSPETVDTLTVDAPLLTDILKYHVVAGRLSPEQVVGTHTTLEGKEVTVTKAMAGELKVANSNVICGGVNTANATVYMIDTVLMPPAEPAM